VIEADELERVCSTGGVTLRGGGAKYDLLRISQNETNSGPWSITPFNLIPYLNSSQHVYHQKKYVLLTW
jgi:hypothetical protein